MRKKCEQIKIIKSDNLPRNLVLKMIVDKQLSNNSFYKLYYFLPDENDKNDDYYELVKYIGDNFDVEDGEVITILISW